MVNSLRTQRTSNYPPMCVLSDVLRIIDEGPEARLSNASNEWIVSHVMPEQALLLAIAVFQHKHPNLFWEDGLAIAERLSASQKAGIEGAAVTLKGHIRMLRRQKIMTSIVGFLRKFWTPASWY